MDFETMIQIIWVKIKEFWSVFFDYTMNVGENKFMLVDNDINYSTLSDQAKWFFIGSFVVMILLAIFASDSFHIFEPIEEMKEWFSKVSVAKVIVFAAAVFSFHTFYKMLIALTAPFFKAWASAAALSCLGTFINPISVMIYGIVLGTIDLRKRGVQAAFLGWAIFLTPAVMSYSSFTREHLAIYGVAIAIGLAGGICYAISTYTPCIFLTCAVLEGVYFIGKFTMLYFSDEMLLLTASAWPLKIGQYFACMLMDLMLCLLLMLILYGLKRIGYGKEHLVRDSIALGIFVVLTFAAVISNIKVKVDPIVVVKPVEEQFFEEEVQEEQTEEVLLPTYIVTVANANIRSGPGTNNSIIGGTTYGTVFYGTGNEQPAQNGTIWFEIYLNPERTQIGWASEKVMQRQ